MPLYGKPMPELILHSGDGKTGTSFLQVLFARYACQLADCGVIYPRGQSFDEASAGRVTSGNGIAMASYISSGGEPSSIDRLERELSQASGKHVLYSSEMLDFIPGERSSSIANVAARNGFKVRVIYFVRDLGLRAVSGYSQWLKRAGDSRSFAEYLSTWQPRYRSRLENACIVFGRECIEVYNYDEKREALSDFFFKTLLGCDFAPTEKPLVNRSLSGKEIELLRYMNRTYGNDPRLATFVSDAMMDAPDQKAPDPLLLTRAEVAMLEEKFASDLTYVNGMVQGRPCIVADRMCDVRQDEELTDLERATAAILAKVVAATVKSVG
jgi:hypothetical protein